MPKLILYYAHPGQLFSKVNAAMFTAACAIDDITTVDLYAEYPRFDIDPDREQQRLLDHDIIVFQFPLFWYSTPSILKEWQDITLEHGFAFGDGGDKLAGKSLIIATTTAGPEDAYRPEGYQKHSLRTFLRPLQQTAKLCKMTFLPPYALYGALKAEDAGAIAPHVLGYTHLLTGLRDGTLMPTPNAETDADTVLTHDALTHDTLPQSQKA